MACTKHLAKIASQAAKPDGLVVVDPGTELEFLDNLPVELMWGVGPVTKARLADIGVCTIGQLARTPGLSLTQLLVPQRERSSRRSLGIVIHGKSKQIIEHNRLAPSQPSARSPLRSMSSGQRYVILPTESAAGFGRNPDLVGL